MEVLRDYGAVGSRAFPNNVFNVTKRGLVYLATHWGDDTRLPFLNRSFISFSYGGKLVEDFGLIATFDNNRMERLGYSSFNDLTTTYDNLDGQQYWGTHFTTNNLEFTLSTDGMTQRLLDDFLHWFVAGESRELILAEHPYRAQLARVLEPPRLQLLPFEENTTFVISGRERDVKTTLYKGSITLKFIMDEPHWYSVLNILGKKSGDRYVDRWTDVNGQEVSLFESKDALKILLEDGIPLGSMIDDNMMFGDSIYASIETDVSLKIWDPNYTPADWDSETPYRLANRSDLDGAGACINGTVNGVNYKGIIAGAFVNADGTGVEELPSGAKAYFFYAGTAPSPTKLSFTFTPTMTNGSCYINLPLNSIAENNPPYNTITVCSISTLQLYLTTPNILTSYNMAIKRIRELVKSSDNHWEDIRDTIRSDVRHPYARLWAIKVIDYAEKYSVTDINNLCTYMSYFLKTNAGAIEPITCMFNSKNGESRGYFRYRKVTSAIPADGAAWLTYGTFFASGKHAEEDIGDMIRSNYLMLRDRNYFTANGRVVKYTSSHPEYSHYLTHDFTVPLTNLLLDYKHMYL